MILVGILIVHGGHPSSAGQWLPLCLERICSLTSGPEYRIYLWNNLPQDPLPGRIASGCDKVHLVQASAGDKFPHAHAFPLQKLYDLARNDGVRYIVTMDTDAFPLNPQWLTQLIGKLNEQNVMAGIWRDELSEFIPPYIHPSCACMPVDFIERYHLRFDDVDVSAGNRLDTLSRFTRIAVEKGEPLYGLLRSNKNQFHYLMGGVYGDLIYHHGAGSRKEITFWGEEKSEILKRRNKAINTALRNMLFDHPRPYIAWLRGAEEEAAVPGRDSIGFLARKEELKKLLLEIDVGDAQQNIQAF